MTDAQRRSLLVRGWRRFTRWIRSAGSTLKHFGTFTLTEAASLEWLRLSSINSFLGLYIFGATVLGTLLAGGYLSAFPTVRHRLLSPMLLVDPRRFYGHPFENQLAPAELTGIVENKPDRTVMMSVTKPVFPTEDSRPLGFMFFEVQTGVARNVGLTEEFAPQGDVLNVKRHLGLEGTPVGEPKRLTDDQVSSWLEFLGWSEIGRVLGKEIHPGGKSLVELEPIINRGAQQSFETWMRLWISSDVLSVLLLENDSNLPASNVRVTISFSGRLQGVQPLLLWGKGLSPFEYDAKTNTIEIRRVAPREQLALLTVSKSAVLGRDVTVSWDRFSEVDVQAIVHWLLVLVVVCGCVVVVSMIPDYRKRMMRKAADT